MSQNKSFWVIVPKDGGIVEYEQRIVTYDFEIPGMLRFFDHMGAPVAVWNISEISCMQYITVEKDKLNYIIKSPAFYVEPCNAPDPWKIPGPGCLPPDVTAPPQQWMPHNPNPEPVPEFQFQEDYLEWAMDNDPDFIKEVTNDD